MILSYPVPWELSGKSVLCMIDVCHVYVDVCRQGEVCYRL